jgi:hypothetical protein
LSPLLFSVLLKDLPKQICGPRNLVKVLLYADDLVIYGRSRFQIQQALARLDAAVKDLGLTINLRKTEALKFRRGGRVARNDSLHLGSFPLAYVNRFPYLGITLPFNGTGFSWHVLERCRKALLATASIRNPQRLSLATAIRLFDLKIAPVAAYGVDLLWSHLTARNLEQLNRVKAAFLKRTMGLHTSARNRLVYLLADCPLLMEDLRHRHNLPRTAAFNECIGRWEQKFAEVDADFYTSGAMTNGAWREVDRPNRHVVARFAVHGFHHKLCVESSFHEPNDTCICNRCGAGCSRYHAADCQLVTSLGSLAH